MKVTIDRAFWLRGEGFANSCLYRGIDGKMCCLGFLAIQLGFKKGQIIGYLNIPGLPANNLGISIPKVITTDFCCQVSDVNDSNSLNDFFREEELKNLFKEVNIGLEFI